MYMAKGGRCSTLFDQKCESLDVQFGHQVVLPAMKRAGEDSTEDPAKRLRTEEVADDSVDQEM